MITASPVPHPPIAAQAASSSSPAAAKIAPQTPPPRRSSRFAAFTIASTVSSVMSPCTASITTGSIATIAILPRADGGAWAPGRARGYAWSVPGTATSSGRTSSGGLRRSGRRGDRRDRRGARRRGGRGGARERGAGLVGDAARGQRALRPPLVGVVREHRELLRGRDPRHAGRRDRVDRALGRRALDLADGSDPARRARLPAHERSLPERGELRGRRRLRDQHCHQDAGRALERGAVVDPGESESRRDRGRARSRASGA